MNHLGTAIVLSMALALLGCGLSSATNDDPLKGNWEGGLLNPDNTTAFGFTATLTQSGSTVSVTNFSLVTPSSCFASGTTATGVFNLTDTTHGVTSGTFDLTIQSGPSNTNGMNSLALQGTFVRNAIGGSWTLTGTGLDCSKEANVTSGNFSMIPMSQPSQ
jgi:hypothetical protein